MADKNDNSEDDIDLFRRAMAGIKRNHRKERHLPRKSVPKPPVKIGKIDVPGLAPGASVMIDETRYGPTLFVRSGLQKKVIRELKRGLYGFTATLDLHGYTIAQAKSALCNFLVNAINARESAVLIIHGKGLRSGESGGVLKPFTLDWLTQQPRVQAFCSALPKDGGTGAVYVLLRVRKTRQCR